MHSLIAVIGALLAAVGSGVLLTRCFRTPRGDLIAWSVALLGLLVSLGSQAMGYVAGYDAAIFRAMEIFGQVVAPLAAIVALSEVAGKSMAARFCARLYVSALGIIALVILALDQLTTATFSKTWPPPFTFYQAPPNYVLMFAIGPVTALIAVIAVAAVLSRSSQPGWRDAAPGMLLGGLAALALAYPGLAEFAVRHLKIHVPLGSVFTIALALAALLAWVAGVQLGRLPLATMHGRAGRDEGPGDRARRSDREASGAYGRAGDRPGRAVDGYGREDRYGRDDRYSRGDKYATAGDHSRNGSGGRSGPDYGRRDEYATGDRDISYREPGYFESVGDGGVYRGGGLYRPERPGQEGAKGRVAGNRPEGDGPPRGYADFATGDFDPGSLADGAAAGGWQQPADGNGQLAGYDEVDAAGHDGLAHDRAGYDGDGQWRGGRRPADRAGRSGAQPDDHSRRELFGQITIYTLAENRLAEFDKLTDRVVEQVRLHEPDTLVFIAHAVPSAPSQRILYQVFRSKSAYQRHLAQSYVQQFELDRRPYVLATNVVELGLQQAKVSPFPSVTDLFPEPGFDTSGFERPDYLRDYGRDSADRGGESREYR